MSNPFELTVLNEEAGLRLDVFLAKHFPEHSRTHLRRVIAAGAAQVDESPVKPSFRVQPGQQISLELPDLPREGPEPENIPLDILYEDSALAAINKPAGMVVHPAKGHWQGTLTAALAFHFENLSAVGGAARPGIVHRLDRDTSGVIVVAKSDQAHLALASQFEARSVEKEYFALVTGILDRDRDLIDQPIGPHPYQREKMAIRGGHSQSREAQTTYEVIERFDGFTAVRATPKTGRTHQIRLHLAHIGCPVLCDRLYGGRATISRREIRPNLADSSEGDDVLLVRQALHAWRLKIDHPQTGKRLELEAPLAPDIVHVLKELRSER